MLTGRLLRSVSLRANDMPFSPAVVITEFTPVFMSRARLRTSEFGEGGLRPNLRDPLGKQVPGRAAGFHQLCEAGHSEGNSTGTLFRLSPPADAAFPLAAAGRTVGVRPPSRRNVPRCAAAAGSSLMKSAPKDGGSVNLLPFGRPLSQTACDQIFVDRLTVPRGQTWEQSRVNACVVEEQAVRFF